MPNEVGFAQFFTNYRDKDCLFQELIGKDYRTIKEILSNRD